MATTGRRLWFTGLGLVLQVCYVLLAVVVLPVPTLLYVLQPELDLRKSDEEERNFVADQMNGVGDKFAKLIKEGGKSLGREVVAISGAGEDEVDDGSGPWEEEEELNHLGA